MARYIDFNELERMINENIKPDTTDDYRDTALIEWCKDECIRQGYAMPTADVVEVVRCKDCKNCDIVYPLKFLGIEAIKDFYCVLDNRRVLSTDYCNRGERKE